MKRKFKIKIDNISKRNKDITISYSVYERKTNDIVASGAGVPIKDYLKMWFNIVFKNEVLILF